jgi:YfiR/HmsC-like
MSVKAFVIGLLLAGGSLPARADIPPERQAVILTRALSYDNNLKGRAGDTVVLAVVYKGGNAASESMADGVFHAFKPLEGVKIQDLPFKVVKVAFTGKDALRSAVSSQGIDALYTCVGLENELGSVRDLGRAQHVLTIGTRESDVTAGLSLGVFITDGKAMINVNLPASREEGAAFSSELLRLARVLH